MNANELADALDNDWADKFRFDAAILLRKQQAEIEALKQIIDANNLNQKIGQFVKPANEPVAWMSVGLDGRTVLANYEFETAIPLYTHPVKDLEDIDINITWNENSMRDFGKDELAFAKAILRKAQET